MKPLSFEEEIDIAKVVFHHVEDGSVWHLPGIGDVPLPEPLTLHGVMIILATLFWVAFALWVKRRGHLPGLLLAAADMFILFIRDHMLRPHIGDDEEELSRWTPFFCTLFVFILTLNLMGMIPLFSTATANLSVTGGLAAIILTLLTVNAVREKGIKQYFQSLIPPGIPAPILIILMPIELIGLIIKSCALMVRLFANMFAGHIVILSLLALVGLFGWMAAPTIIIAAAIGLMELFVAFLQAYIFTILSSIFIGMVYYTHH